MKIARGIRIDYSKWILVGDLLLFFLLRSMKTGHLDSVVSLTVKSVSGKLIAMHNIVVKISCKTAIKLSVTIKVLKRTLARCDYWNVLQHLYPLLALLTLGGACPPSLWCWSSFCACIILSRHFNEMFSIHRYRLDSIRHFLFCRESWLEHVLHFCECSRATCVPRRPTARASGMSGRSERNRKRLAKGFREHSKNNSISLQSPGFSHLKIVWARVWRLWQPERICIHLNEPARVGTCSNFACVSWMGIGQPSAACAFAPS